MSGVRYPSVQELEQLRDAIILKSRDFRQMAPARLVTPLQSIENRLANIVPTTSSISPMDSIMYRDELCDYNDLLNDLENWNSHNNNTVLSQQRQLIEVFISQSLRQIPTLGNHDVFVINSDRVVVNDQHGLGFNIIRLHRDFFNDPKHWCLCAHEIGAHILKDAQLQPSYQPNLQPHMTNPNYRTATQIWSYEYPPRRDGWFSEVYGDLYSCRITGPSYLLGFNDYTSRSPNSSTVGNRKHPPPSLRITLMKEYLDGQGFHQITLPDHVPLPTLIPDLTIDDVISKRIPFRGPLNQIRNEIYDPVLIDEAVRIADSNLNNIQWNTSDIQASYQAICNGNIVGNNLVADISGLALFHHTNNGPLGEINSQMMDTYL